MRTKLDNNQGSALLISLALMAMLALVGIMATDTADTDIDLSFNQVHADEAFYIADAGAKKAIATIMADTSWTAGFTDEDFGRGTFTVSVADSSTDSTLFDTVVIIAQGSIDGAFATVQYELAPDVYYPFKYAMFGDDLIDIRNSMNVDSYNSDSGSYWTTRMNADGDIGSNGDIIVKNGGFVGGDVQTSELGGLYINGGATVTGDTSDTAPEQTLPEIPQSEFDWADSVSVAGDSISGSYTYNSSTKTFLSTGTVTLGSGVYFFSDIILKNSASLQIAPGANVVIYITGDIEMKNSSEMNVGGDPADLMIYSQGDFVLKNSGDVAATFYSPNGSADLRNSGEFYGSIVANDIVAHNSSKFHYDRNLGNITMGGTGDLLIVAFREL